MRLCPAGGGDGGNNAERLLASCVEGCDSVARRLVELIRTVTLPTRPTILLLAGFGLDVIACADDTKQLEVGQLILLFIYLLDADRVVDAAIALPPPGAGRRLGARAIPR